MSSLSRTALKPSTLALICFFAIAVSSGPTVPLFVSSNYSFLTSFPATYTIGEIALTKWIASRVNKNPVSIILFDETGTSAVQDVCTNIAYVEYNNCTWMPDVSLPPKNNYKIMITQKDSKDYLAGDVAILAAAKAAGSGSSVATVYTSSTSIVVPTDISSPATTASSISATIVSSSSLSSSNTSPTSTASSQEASGKSLNATPDVPAAQSQTEQQPSSLLSTGAIVGAAIGSLVAGALLTSLVAIFIFRRRRRQSIIERRQLGLTTPDTQACLDPSFNSPGGGSDSPMVYKSPPPVVPQYIGTGESYQVNEKPVAVPLTHIPVEMMDEWSQPRFELDSTEISEMPVR